LQITAHLPLALQRHTEAGEHHQGDDQAHDEVGRVGAFLLSDMSDGVTAEILHIDGGYNAMGSPGRLLDKIRGAQP